MDKELINKVKQKKEFSQLPNNIITQALKQHNNDVKETRACLRKYFGVFLTNKIIKGKGTAEELLKTHLSSKKRDYNTLYKKIFEDNKHWSTLIDFGCGVNGLTFNQLQEHHVTTYLGIEASGQIVNLMNDYFKDQNIEHKADVIHLNLFDNEEVQRLIEGTSKPRIVFLFQTLDALEALKQNYSKELLTNITPHFERIIISMPLTSLGGKKTFSTKRNWLTKFLQEHFIIEKDFVMEGERFLIITKK